MSLANGRAGGKHALEAAPERPKALRVKPEAIPAVLKGRDQWVCWRYERRDGKWTKRPVSPKGGRPASSTDPATCEDTLYDADWLGESLDAWGQQHATPPLRLARIVGARASDPASLVAAWAPRLKGAPFADDSAAWTPGPPLLASVTAYLAPLGQHDWSVGDPCQAWDGTTYMDNLLGHFFATNGHDLYYLSHPSSHACLRDSSCPWFQ